jgi:hypothetical protein
VEGHGFSRAVRFEKEPGLLAPGEIWMPHPSRAFCERVGVLTLRVDPKIHGFPALRLDGKGTASAVPLDPKKTPGFSP